MVLQLTDKRSPNYFSFVDSEEYATGLMVMCLFPTSID